MSFLMTDGSGHVAGPHSDMLRNTLVDLDAKVKEVCDDYAARGAIESVPGDPFPDEQATMTIDIRRESRQVFMAPPPQQVSGTDPAGSEPTETAFDVNRFRRNAIQLEL
jgi:hypothetical protein